jgi:hypothetical protein
LVGEIMTDSECSMLCFLCQTLINHSSPKKAINLAINGTSWFKPIETKFTHAAKNLLYKELNKPIKINWHNIAARFIMAGGIANELGKILQWSLKRKKEAEHFREKGY